MCQWKKIIHKNCIFLRAKSFKRCDAPLLFVFVFANGALLIKKNKNQRSSRENKEKCVIANGNKSALKSTNKS